MSFGADSQDVGVVVERFGNSASVPREMSRCNRTSVVYLTQTNAVDARAADGAVFFVS